MAIDFKQYLKPDNMKKIRKALSKELIVGCVLVVILIALFGGNTTTNVKNMPETVSISGASAIELSVVNVNPIIAREFNLPNVSGVLVNDTPKGTARKIIGLRRGDMVLKYNNVEVQSVSHLEYLMYHQQSGDTVNFLIWRNGRMFDLSARLPQSAGIKNIYNSTFLNIIIVLVILILTFTALFFNLIERTVCVVLGAAVMMVFGAIFGFYNQTKAFNSIDMSPILIFVGMSVFSIFLERLKFFDYISKKIIVRMKADVIKVVFALCIMTYVFSLFVNNLSTILVIIPITLYICKGLNINPVSVVIAEVIASNIGGASTMTGDFPNMLISSSTGLLFFDFLVFMAPICLVMLLFLLWYMKQFEFSKNKRRKSPIIEKEFLEKLEEDLSSMKIDWPAVKRVIIAVGCVIAGLMILPFFRIKPATIAFTGGAILLAIENKNAKDVLKRLNFADIIFFIALFIIVGGALHSGLLKGISDIISSLSMGNKMLYLIILMWTAAFFTAFLNAGPATAFFIPIVLHAHFAAFGDIVWWALSLGVLAGSSATITGATAGIVTQTIIEENRFLGIETDLLTFGNYSKKGVPIALMFLVISTVYILFLCSIPGIK